MNNRCMHGISVLIGLFIFVFISHPSLALAISADSDLEFNVREKLTISVTAPDTGAAGNIGQFLRNKYTISVKSNNNGFTASMTTKSSTADLVNVFSPDDIIPTLVSSCPRASCPADFWGYSLNDIAAGDNDSTYNKIAAIGEAPNIIMSNETGPSSGSQDVYFGTTISSDKPSGDYLATIVFSVVTGTIDPENNPVTPEDPIVPGGPSDNPSYDQDSDMTTYTSATYDSATDSTTTTTEISKGDNRSGYAAPQGVTTTNINEGTPLATGLAVTAAISATTGVIFFIVSKRRKDEDE